MLKILAGTIVWYNGAKFAVELMLRNLSALLLCFKVARRDAINNQATHAPSRGLFFALKPFMLQTYLNSPFCLKTSELFLPRPSNYLLFLPKCPQSEIPATASTYRSLCQVFENCFQGFFFAPLASKRFPMSHGFRGFHEGF